MLVTFYVESDLCRDHLVRGRRLGVLASILLLSPSLDSSTEADLSRAKATLSSQIDDAAYMSAQSMLSGPTSLYVTASNGIPSDNHCASSIRKKEQETMDLSVQATQGSDNATRDPEPKEEADVISPSS